MASDFDLIVTFTADDLDDAHRRAAIMLAALHNAGVARPVEATELLPVLPDTPPCRVVIAQVGEAEELPPWPGQFMDVDCPECDRYEATS